MKRPLSVLIRQSRHRFRLFIAALAYFAGLFILLVSTDGYQRFHRYFENAEKNQDSYLIINKGVQAIQSFGSKYRSGFSEEEIEYIREQAFVLDLGSFSNSTFRISSNLAERLSIYTDLFFESVPDRFLDTIPPGWGWKEGSDFIPVIINREWLNLYNFNVSLMYGLPQISEEMLSKWTLDVIISGNGRSRHFRSRILAFSDRIPSVTVPESFLLYANEKYGQGTPPPARLILRVRDISDPKLLSFLNEQGYHYRREKAMSGNFRTLAAALLLITSLTGFLFVLFAFTIVLTTVELAISDISENLRLLIHLGYKPSGLAQMYFREALLFISVAAILAWLAFLEADRSLGSLLEAFSQGKAPLSIREPLLLGILCTSLLLLYLRINIGRRIRKLA